MSLQKPGLKLKVGSHTRDKERKKKDERKLNNKKVRQGAEK